MKGLKRTSLLFMFLLVTGFIYAQKADAGKKTFEAHADSMLYKFNIICKMPCKFIDLNYMEPWKITEKGKAGMFYYPIFQSDNRECLLMYSYIPLLVLDTDTNIWKAVEILNKTLKGEDICAEVEKVKKETSTIESTNSRNHSLVRNQIIFELKTALGMTDDLGFQRDDLALDFDDYVTVFGGKQVKVHFNADSVFIYDIPLERPYKNEYNYCKGMAIYKKGCPIMCFKWFFSDAGIKKADKYIKRLNKKVWYKHVIN